MGRTARYKSKGNAILFVTPSEQKMIEAVQQRGIQLKKLNANPNQSLTIQPTLQKLNAENRDVKHLAEKACISYIKSIYLMKNKQVFKFEELDTEKLAYSLGLANAPQIGFISKSQVKNTQRENKDEDDALMDVADGEGAMNVEGGAGAKKLSRLQVLRQKIREKKEAKKAELMKQELKEAEEYEEEGQSQDEDEDDEEDNDDEDEEGESDYDDEESGSGMEEDEEDEDGDFFTSKKSQRRFSQSEEEDEAELREDEELREQIKQQELKVSKNKLRKITKDGPLQGKNKVFLGPDGKPISSIEHHLMMDKIKA